MKWLAVAGAAVAVTMVASTPALAAPAPLPTPKGGYGAKISPSLMGMHVHYLTDEGADTAQKFGAVRIWDNGVRWDQVNPEPGVYNWDALDRVVANAQAVGAKEIIYVLGSTPLWAAKYPEAGFPYYYGPGTASVPANLDDWRNWVRAVAERYKGKITAYQPWNEANLQAFFYAGEQDSAVAMAELTKAAKEVVDAVDPAATFSTASSTVIQTKRYTTTTWFPRYLGALRSGGVRPDTISVHLYPWLKQGPGNGTLAQREKGLSMAKEVIANNGYRKLPIWDTEMNYGNQRLTNPWPKVKYSQKKGSAYLAQTYLYSLSNGVTQVYWYGWDDYGLGTWTTSKSGVVLKPGDTYNNLSTWLAGAKNGGCTPIGSVSTCTIKRKKTKQFFVFRNKTATRKYSVPAKWKVRQQCTVLDACKPIRKGKVKVGLSPLLLTK
jgi:GH35 family endo-1,4-beta-xylanase